MIATISVVIIIIASAYWYTKTKSKRHPGNLCYGLYLPFECTHVYTYSAISSNCAHLHIAAKVQSVFMILKQT